MSTIGQAAGIDHGTPRGYRQHIRRQVMPVCDKCQAAHDDDELTGDRSTEHEWNANTADRKPPGAKTTTARPLTPLQRRDGARIAAANALDLVDLVELLDALDLTAADGKQPATSTAGAR